MNERDVIPALRWKPGRSSGKLSLWRSGHLLWSELPPFKGFWTQASWFQEAESSTPPPSFSLRCSPLSPWTLFPRLRGGHLPCHSWSAPFCLALARQPGASFGLFSRCPECGGRSGWLGFCGSQQLRPLRPRAEKDPRNLVERCRLSHLSGFGKGPRGSLPPGYGILSEGYFPPICLAREGKTLPLEEAGLKHSS